MYGQLHLLMRHKLNVQQSIYELLMETDMQSEDLSSSVVEQSADGEVQSLLFYDLGKILKKITL